MLPSQLKRLYGLLCSLGETVRAELHGAIDVLQKQEGSLRNAGQAWEKKQTEVGTTIAAAIKTAADTVPEYEKNQRQKELAWQKALFWVTLFGAMAAAAAAGGAIYYAGVAKDTYVEIQRQTKATICAAEAAQSAAKTASDALGENKRQFSIASAQNQKQFSDTLAQIKAQTVQQKTSADAAQAAARTAQDTLVASNRPWLIAAPVSIFGPLEFTRGTIVLPVSYSIRNTGHSPAIKASINVEIFVPRYNVEREPEIELKSVCTRAENLSSQTGQAIFPTGDGPEIQGGVSTATNFQVDSARSFIIPTIILCIAYQSTLNENTWHHTGMIFTVDRVEPATPKMTFAIQPGQNLPADRLRLTLSSFQGVTAD